MKRWLPEAIALPLLPLLIAQGKHARRVTPRLPEAEGERQGLAGRDYSGTPFSIMAIGESPVAGVGVKTQVDAITSRFAEAISMHLKRPVTWQAYGKNGIKVSDAMEQILPAIPRQRIDLVLIAFGVNDTTSFHSVQRWKKDLRQLLDAIQLRCEPTLVAVSGVPQMANLPALPQPLRWVMGLKAQALDNAARHLAASRQRTCHIPLRIDPSEPALMASDGYHPSAKGCDVWAQMLVDALIHEIPTP